MSKPLIIVESPTKVKTIKKYLGDKYNVASTVGHIKDLPEKELGIDVENNFTPRYVTVAGKQKVIKALRAAGGDYAVTTQSYKGRDGEWDFVWACTAPPAGVGELVLSPIVVEGLAAGAVYADDVFLCPVAPLIREARERRRHEPR